MQIQVNTDRNIEGSAELTSRVQAMVEGTLSRFDNWITRVEIQLSDESSSSKTRDKDHRCIMEARPASQQPISVSHQGTTLDQAVKGSVKKMERLLNDTKERLKDPKGNTSYAGDQST